MLPLTLGSYDYIMYFLEGYVQITVAIPLHPRI